jgi:ribA/ribD-fused uncharacterized protein
MIFRTSDAEPLYVSRSDANSLLSSYSPHGFFLDDADWPTVEHYYQGLKFTDPDQRAAIRATPTPSAAKKLADKHAKAVRKDWKKIRETVMTRGLYIKSQAHPEIANALVATGGIKIVENSMYDYYWGCGRDGRGHNTYGKVLMAIREKLNVEKATSSCP